MDALSLYSREYAEARDRFCQAAGRAGLSLSCHPIKARGPRGESLSLDVAERRVPGARKTLVISSGTHGVEGFFGSAVQLDFLRGAGTSPAAEALNLVLVHAMNPFGFAHTRRVNEDNVDLNRNFVVAGEAFRGAAPLYATLDPLLNPRSAPRGLDPFLAVAAGNVLRHGFTAVKNAIAQGQYDFPRGLFFGGHGDTESSQIVRRLALGWARDCTRVVHVDLHTGMGRYGTYALLADLPVSDPRIAQLGRDFGANYVQGFDPNGVLYEIRGSLSRCLDSLGTGTTYDCLLAEFGTHPSLAVLRALRFDNRVAHYAPDDARLIAQAREGLMEAFCPRDPSWRAGTVHKASAMLVRALKALAS